MRTHNIPSCYRKSKRPSLFLLTWRFYQPSMVRTCLELISMVPKVFEQLKFDCNLFVFNGTADSKTDLYQKAPICQKWSTKIEIRPIRIFKVL